MPRLHRSHHHRPKTRMPAITGKIRMWAATNHAILRNLRSIRSRRASICKIASSISRSMDATLRRWQQPQKDAGSRRRPLRGPWEPPPSISGSLWAGAPRWRSSSKSGDHRSCSSLPKACDRAPGPGVSWSGDLGKFMAVGEIAFWPGFALGKPQQVLASVTIRTCSEALPRRDPAYRARLIRSAGFLPGRSALLWW